MRDIRDAPWAEWAEATLRAMLEEDIASIALATISRDGGVGTAYYGCGSREIGIAAKLLLARALDMEAEEDAEDGAEDGESGEEG